MYTDKEEFEGWMQRIMERFDTTEKLLERVLKKNSQLDGEEVLESGLVPAAESGHTDIATIPGYGAAALLHDQREGILPGERCA